MAKYLIEFDYTTEGLKGVLKEGGSKRRQAIEQLAKSLGGKMEAFYYAFGDHDGFVIWDMPDSVAHAAAALLVNASGAAKVKTVVLLTPEELDQATKKVGDYRPPGK
jgi:uncharacterized protein with GYD domain